MYADVADYSISLHGTSSTGLIFSSGTMAQKLGSALSGGLVAVLLGVAGFSSGTDPQTGLAVVSISGIGTVTQMIWSMFSIFPALFAALMLLFIRIYPIRK